MDDLKEFMTFMTILLGSLTLFCILSIGLIIRPLDIISCNSYEKHTGKETKYGFLECYVNIDGEWYSSEQYKNTLIGKEINNED